MIKRFSIVLALLLSLAACGGGSVSEPVVSPVQPSASAPVVVPIIPPVSTPVTPPVSVPIVPQKKYWEVDWATKYTEQWTEYSVGGWIRPKSEGKECGNTDVTSGFISFPPSGYIWSSSNGQSFTIENNHAMVNSTQFGGGYSVITHQNFDHTKPVRLSAKVTLEPDVGSWIGFTLIQQGSQYREISITWRGNGFMVQRYSPCTITDLMTVQYGEHELALEYFPQVGWRYLLNNVEIHFEPIDSPGALMQNRLHAGIFIVNLEGEARRQVGFVRAKVGELKVQTSE